jgi:hypothetical protein
MSRRQAGVYCCYDINGALLYFGFSYTPRKGIESHLLDAWAYRMTRATVRTYRSRDIAITVASWLIETYHPEFNRLRRPSRAWRITKPGLPAVHLDYENFILENHGID